MKNKPDAGVITTALNYFYLLSFCPPEKKEEFNQAASGLVGRMFSGSGEDRPGHLETLCYEAAARILSFHTASRYPDEEAVQALAERMMHANDSAEALIEFQDAMDQTALLPGRSV